MDLPTCRNEMLRTSNIPKSPTGHGKRLYINDIIDIFETKKQKTYIYINILDKGFKEFTFEKPLTVKVRSHMPGKDAKLV